MEKNTAAAEAAFAEYFGKNYPRDTIIGDPMWHVPRIFRAAQHAIASHPAPQAAAEGVGSIGDDAEFQSYLERWRMAHSMATFPKVDKGVIKCLADLIACIDRVRPAAPERPAIPAQGQSELPVEFNREKLAHMLNRLSLANRREGWTTSDPWKDREHIKRAADSVAHAESELMAYIEALAIRAAQEPAASCPDYNELDQIAQTWMSEDGREAVADWIERSKSATPPAAPQPRELTDAVVSEIWKATEEEWLAAVRRELDPKDAGNHVQIFARAIAAYLSTAPAQKA